MNGMVDINELYITPDNKRMIIDVSVKTAPYYDNVYLDSITLDTQDTYVETGVSSEWILKRDIVPQDYIAKIAWETQKVDEYMDIICSLQKHCHTHYHHHHHRHCGCHDVCNHRTYGTGCYSNPIVYTTDIVDDTTVYYNEREEVITFIEGCFYKQKDTDLIQIYNGNELKDASTVLGDPQHVKHARIEIKQEDVCQPFTDTMFFVYIKTKGTPASNTPCSMDNEYTMGVCVNEFNIYRRFMCLMRELLSNCDIPKGYIDLYLRWEAVKNSVKTGHYMEAILYWKRFFLFHHQRPLWEQPQYIEYWKDFHPDQLMPMTNYPYNTFGFGGSLTTCRRCGL